MKWQKLFPTKMFVCAIVTYALITTSYPGHTSGESAQLLMVEQTLCEWCEKWEEEIGAIYPKSWEGKKVPLKKVDMHKPIPEYEEYVSTVIFTPTFILIVDGKEIGRIVGYAGDNFFWSLLDNLLARAKIFQAK